MANDDRIKYLADDEIERFLDELDKNNDGLIDYSEVEHRLDLVHREIAPSPQPHHLHHDGRTDEARHRFLRSLVGDDQQKIPRAQFAERVKTWAIPSPKQADKAQADEQRYVQSLSVWRRVRSYWAVHGHEILFIALVVSMQLAFGIWQCVKYATGSQYGAALGWGVVLAKTCAGALYPTMFFLVLSMSRYFATFMRRSTRVSRFVNWDLSQAFHIRISMVALALATLHAIGHLSGSFNWGSQPERQEAVGNLLGPDMIPRPYVEYVRSLPGYTGITALGLFYLLSLYSIPQIRTKNYELFQLFHLLMFPIIGLLMAHGAMGLLQWPMLGYFLAFPTLLVIIERTIRVGLGFHHIKATLQVLDEETVEVKATIPHTRMWQYEAGQYVFLQVPEISFFQWHPFTVSTCVNKDVWLHIKTDGNWTSKLRNLGEQGKVVDIEIGINGPFGAPAQRFYDFTHTIIVGAGIGVTPFSGILADLQAKDDRDHGQSEVKDSVLNDDDEVQNDSSEASTQVNDGNGHQENDSANTMSHATATAPTSTSRRVPSQVEASSDYRRVDFHWMVRDRNHLLWFSDLLNAVARSQQRHHHNSVSPNHDNCHLDINIHTHVTKKRKGADISTHVYRWLLEKHRTPEHPASPLTGLLNQTGLGRPDFVGILDRHYEDMEKFRAYVRQERGNKKTSREDGDDVGDDKEVKVGVFFCGTPIIGEILADHCRQLTARGRAEGTRIEYHFTMEVFG
ncbi:FAD-binding domain-containing protein [Apiospora hydei]|uniref:FAD-binding domain-containing protein n=1 Tax=Apiospora hydei TaxID=1337664 RepID=A0ABR1V2F7_9PEZI